MGGVAVIKEGWAQVKESRNFIQPWKQKFLILRKEALDFHKTEGGKVSYTLYLKDVVGVGRVEAAGTIFEIKRQISGQSNSPGDDDGSVRSLQIRTKSDDDLYDWIDVLYGRCPTMGGVSNPTNFSHAVHVGFDPQTGQFVGLPPEWSKLLNSSAITKEDYERNPQAVFEVLDFYSDLTKRAENPSQYPSLTPTPPAGNMNNKQLGYSGSSVAPPRPLPPGQAPPRPINPNQSMVNASRPTMSENSQQRQQMQNMASNYMSPNAGGDRQKEYQRQMDERREMDEYNASLPKSRPPMAQQEIGGYGGGAAGSPDRYNPTRAAPPAPKNGNQQQAQLRAQRPAPPAPGSAGAQRPPIATQQSSSASGQRTPPQQASSQQRYQNGANGSSQPRSNGQSPQSQASRLPGPTVKPLNVPAKPQPQSQPQSDAVKAAEAALTAKPPATERKQDVRMSTMSEKEVMARLVEVVSKEDPNLSYSKQKKIGQGASGSVYVAKVKEGTTSAVAREVLRSQGSRAQVAIKQMDLAHQPRKELIVNEILVMKDSKHRNIVNFLDAFLRNNNAELWVVMEYMEGGALTDVIDNNPVITEEQISTICLEVSQIHTYAQPDVLCGVDADTLDRHAAVSSTCTRSRSSTVTSRVTTSCLMLMAASRLVR
jgi:serine/threonine-protein kinase CLA4